MSGRDVEKAFVEAKLMAVGNVFVQLRVDK